MKILIACEESQRVCAAFREKGHEAYSCDIIDCSGGHPEWHIQQDCLPLLNGNCSFTTKDGIDHKIDSRWDMIIAHPPCTYLTTTGNRWFNIEKYGEKAVERLKEREKAIDFFFRFVNADCDKIIIENPVGIMSTKYRKPDQIIHPYYFAKDEKDIENIAEKRTCLWLKGVNKLSYEIKVSPPEREYYKSGKSMPKWYSEAAKLPKEERSKIRSKTFLGIAKAMADQWG